MLTVCSPPCRPTAELQPGLSANFDSYLLIWIAWFQLVTINCDVILVFLPIICYEFDARYIFDFPNSQSNQFNCPRCWNESSQKLRQQSRNDQFSLTECVFLDSIRNPFVEPAKCFVACSCNENFNFLRLASILKTLKQSFEAQKYCLNFLILFTVSP